MGANEIIRNSIRKIAGTNNTSHEVSFSDKATIYTATVDSVDEAARTCSCTLISGITDISLDTVQLMAGVNDGLLLIPTVDSTVRIAHLQNVDPFVILFSQLDKVLMIVGDTEIQLVNGTTTIMQGEMQVVLSGGKINISNGSNSLFDVLKSFMSNVMKITVPTPSGTSGMPLNDGDMSTDLSNLSNIMY